MAERLAGIVTQIQNVRQLGAVVTAMRGIAALRAQEGRSLLAGIEAYTDVVSRSIGQALNLLSTDTLASAPPRHAKRGLILFCAEQGFAGPFSERVFEAAAGDLAAGHEHSRRHAWRSSCKRARNQARLVGGDDHARRWDPKFRKSAG